MNTTDKKNWINKFESRSLFDSTKKWYCMTFSIKSYGIMITFILKKKIPSMPKINIFKLTGG
jgi:hypothetical protein